jgi:hypothetical protein
VLTLTMAPNRLGRTLEQDRCVLKGRLGDGCPLRARPSAEGLICGNFATFKVKALTYGFLQWMNAGQSRDYGPQARPGVRQISAVQAESTLRAGSIA